MRLFTRHEATCLKPDPPAPYYSLGLPAWASPAAGRPPSRARAARHPSSARLTLRHIRHQLTGSRR